VTGLHQKGVLDKILALFCQRETSLTRYDPCPFKLSPNGREDWNRKSDLTRKISESDISCLIDGAQDEGNSFSSLS
jgi:hypothetical protein